MSVDEEKRQVYRFFICLRLALVQSIVGLLSGYRRGFSGVGSGREECFVHMRSIGIVIAALLVGMLTGPAWGDEARPMRIVSTNLCADELALSIAGPQRVVSVSWVAGDSAISNVASMVNDIARNDAELEEVLAANPDLVLTDSFAGETLARRLDALGVRVHRVGWSSSIADAVAIIRDAALAMDDVARGEALITWMGAELASARMLGAMAPPVEVLMLRPAGHSASGDALAAEMLALAGLSDMALAGMALAQGFPAGREMSLETIVALAPPLIVLDAPTLSGQSQAESLLRHRAIAHIVPKPMAVLLPTRYWICAGPHYGRAALLLAAAGADLRTQRRALAQ